MVKNYIVEICSNLADAHAAVARHGGQKPIGTADAGTVETYVSDGDGSRAFQNASSPVGDEARVLIFEA